MYCSQCGQQIADTSRFCPNCGAPVATAGQQPQPQPQPQPTPQPEPWTQPVQPQQEPWNQPAQPQHQTWQQPAQPQTWQQPSAQGRPAQFDKYPMKWYKFLIYFLTFFSAVVLVINGFSMMTGLMYGGDAQIVYAFFPSMRYLDILIGLLTLGQGAFWIYVRFRLSAFRADAPKMVQAIYTVSIIINLFYGICASAILSGNFGPEGSPMISALFSAVGSIIMIVANKAYFDKRAELFVN